MEDFYDDVWKQMAIDVDKEITGTYAHDSVQEKPLTIDSINKIISDFQNTIRKHNPIYKLAKDNGFNLLKGDVAIISINTAMKMGMEDNTDNIKISLYAEDDQIYFLKGSEIDMFA